MIIIFCPANQELGLRVIDYAFEWDACLDQSQQITVTMARRRRRSQRRKMKKNQEVASMLPTYYSAIRPWSPLCLPVASERTRYTLVSSSTTCFLASFSAGNSNSPLVSPSPSPSPRNSRTNPPFFFLKQNIC